MTENWQIFNKDHEPHDGIKNLPEPPPWRSFNTEVQTTEISNIPSQTLLCCNPCQICGAEFTSTYYKSHLKTHDEKTVCNICNKEVSKTGLKEHMRRMHTKDEEKMFQCPDCGKGFTKLYALDKHKMNVHLKLRPYKCRYGCTFAYNDISNRNAHERKTHGGLFQPNSKLNDEN